MDVADPAIRSLSSAIPLQNLEAVLQALNQHAIVSIADAAGRITFVNDKFCEVSGYSREELIGNNHRMLRSGEHPPEFFIRMWDALTTGQTWQGEICNRRKDGELYWVESTIVPVVDENGIPCQYASVRTDITNVKAVELQLRRSEAGLEAAQRLAGMGSWEYCLQSGDIRWSEQVYRIYGFAPGGLAPHVSAFYALAHPDDRELLRDTEADILKHGHSEVTHRIVRPDGTIRWVHELAEAVCDSSGEPVKLVGTVQDVTAVKQAEIDMAQAKALAEEASRAKSEFLSHMSHELRTPLNAILGFGQLLEADASLDLDSRDAASEIVKAGRHLLGLINEVLDLARLESGHVAINLEALNLQEAVEECAGLVKPLAASRGIQITHAISAELGVQADRTRLRQVLLNLLSNAVKYNREGGTVHLEATAGAGLVRMTVCDSGKGIPSDRLSELFQPFNRLAEENGAVEGTGIGLSLTRQLMELMNGAIGATSQLGEGTCFWIELRAGQGEFEPTSNTEQGE